MFLMRVGVLGLQCSKGALHRASCLVLRRLWNWINELETVSLMASDNKQELNSFDVGKLFQFHLVLSNNHDLPI